MIRIKNHRLINAFLIIILVLNMFSISMSKADACSNEYKGIKTIDIDTTGDKVKEKTEILTDEKNNGYIVKVFHGNKAYTLKPARDFGFLAPYTPFWSLNTIVADINSDSIPEIVTWGDSAHENPIHIFRWDGACYKIIFSGFYQGFSFKDITGDSVLEFVIENRLYGTGHELIYYQWQKNKYKKIYYEIVANRGFAVLEGLLEILHVEQFYMYNREILSAHFTDEWLDDKNNLEFLRRFKKGLFRIQIVEYIDNKIEWKDGTPIKETWKFKVKTYRKVGTAVLPKELTMTVDMDFIDNTNFDGWDKWRIDNIRFVE